MYSCFILAWSFATVTVLSLLGYASVSRACPIITVFFSASLRSFSITFMTSSYGTGRRS